MTTIVAVQTEDDVILGWDSLATRDNEMHTSIAQKVWCRDGIVYGVSGHMRFADLLYAADFPPYDGTDARRWIIKEFVPVLQTLLNESGHGLIMLDDEGGLKSSLLMVVDGTVYSLDGSLSPLSTEEGVFTLGSGGDYARGALFAGANVEKAVAIAAAIDPYSGGNIHIASANELIMAEEVE